MTKWTSITLLILYMSLLIFPVTGVCLWLIGRVDSVSYALNLISPITALSIGTMGLLIFAFEGVIRDDMIHTMCVAIAMGLTLLTLAEIALVMVSILAGSTLFYVVMAFLQLPGLIIWTAGVLGYVYVFNRVVNIMQQTRLAISIISGSIVALLVVKVIAILYYGTRGVIESLVCLPIEICLLMMISSLIMIIWLIRGGTLRYPFGTMLFAVILYAVQSLLLYDLMESPLSPLVRGIAFESYVLLGISLIMFRRLGE